MKFGLRTKFLAPALIILTILLTLFGAVTYVKVKSVLKSQAKAQMLLQVESSSLNLAAWVHRAMFDVESWATEKVFREALPDTFIATAFRKQAQANLERITSKHAFYDIVVLTDAQGTPITASDAEKARQIKDLCQGILSGNDITEGRFSPVFKSSLTNSAALMLTVPVEQKGLKGYMFAQLNLAYFRENFMSKMKFGESGRAFLMESKGLIVSHQSHSNKLQMDFVIDIAKSDLGTKYAGQERGVYEHVLGADMDNSSGQDYITAICQIEGTDLATGLSAKASEIYAGANEVSVWVAGIGFLLLLAIGFSILILVQVFIITPINTVSKGLQDVAQGEGDLTRRLDVSSQDEVGDLASWFNKFMDKQQSMIREIMESAHSLATLTAQISTTASQFASSATEMGSSVSEISTTGEEVKETMRVSSEKAESVAQSAEDTEKVSQSGLSATAYNLDGMVRIKDEMQYIAESIVKLSEQTQNIAEIIDAVNELANQSNLLSVNASIEAAKAGEFGKGFAVVAQEVKSLADQSKQATEQVRNILQEIQNATSAAVMATERGSKAVDEGSHLSSEAEEAIRKLSLSTTESSKSSRLIAASAQQQLAGMEQLSQALESIKLASEQNVDSAKQLEESTIALNSLGSMLTEMAGKFKV
ncbi:Methyl-accepting chemotaxis sensory transducer [Desulfatibacillum aliphaticivorans]|uniref:Methyl-accepting chemotaxis sensory transducer n=1 Tax=Desulfatibacillum aliphaticivorans TaxID=218208 RepID=B8FI76_DESAL|nr:methyl-accepting chemotaxis protein [Desulfatibacillum aliphaticivorans]ACL02643.1 Methyl-accepting chemotaxis sensory transducer [Desulfatibacillum aliphaticivorans]